MRLMILLVIAAAAFTVGNVFAAQRPNIVFILVDDLGWSDLGCYGHPWHQTPHIDRLANQGMRFTNGYSPAPICSAARASILTGKAVPRLGFEFVTKNEAGHQRLDSKQPLQTPPITLNLPLDEHTIAERFSTRSKNRACATTRSWCSCRTTAGILSSVPTLRCGDRSGTCTKAESGFRCSLAGPAKSSQHRHVTLR